MKIAILADEIAPGSAPKLIGWPIRKLKELGVEAEAVVIIDKGYWKKHKELYDFHLEGVRVRYIFPSFPWWIKKINFRFPGMSFFSLHHIASMFFARRAVQEKEFDLIIANCQYSAFAAQNIKRFCKIPFLLLIWDPSIFTAEKIYKNRFRIWYPFLAVCARLLDRFAFAQCEAIITSGRFHHQYLKRITKKPLEILSPGCFVKKELPDFSKRKPMIFTYDRWDIGNNPIVFLDILSKLHRNDIVLTIGGFWHPDNLQEEFLRDVKRRGLENHITILGPLDEDMIMKICSQAMVHVHPVHEAFGMQTLEAAGCGCPGIIPAGSGVADLFKHRISGLHPPLGDLKAFINCINSIFDDEAFAQQMGESAWKIAQKYTWLNYAENLKAIADKYVKN